MDALLGQSSPRPNKSSFPITFRSNRLIQVTMRVTFISGFFIVPTAGKLVELYEAQMVQMTLQKGIERFSISRRPETLKALDKARGDVAEIYFLSGGPRKDRGPPEGGPIMTDYGEATKLPIRMTRREFKLPECTAGSRAALRRMATWLSRRYDYRFRTR